MNTHTVRLTSLAHGGGCGCKLAPSVLQQLLADQPATAIYKQLLVGTETSDDAAVWQVDDNTCVIATTDFFMPMVDDPYDFGRIAATNAISDVYAMGGKPIMALAILGMPVDKIPVEMVREILKGGAAVCGIAGIPVAGGHSIDCPEPVYGLAVIGTCHPSQVRRNADARPGDALILTKAIGVGVYSAAVKKGLLTDAGYAEMIATTTLLNRIGADLAKSGDVHAMTTDDVVFARTPDALTDALADFAARDIERAALQAHVEGIVVKFYGVADGRFFRCYTPGAEIPVALPTLWDAASAGAAALGLDVFGGDLVVGADGRPVIVDLNDWPSFARCRDEAADAIAGYVVDRVAAASWPRTSGQPTEGQYG